MISSSSKLVGFIQPVTNVRGPIRPLAQYAEDRNIDHVVRMFNCGVPVYDCGGVLFVDDIGEGGDGRSRQPKIKSKAEAA